MLYSPLKASSWLYFHFYSRDMKPWKWWMLKNDIIAADPARCGGTEITKKANKQKYRRERDADKGRQRSSTERENRVGVTRAPAGKEEAGWSRELEFETQSMKGGLLPHRPCLHCCRNSISHFCSLCLARESQKMGKCEITVMGSNS